MEGTRLGAKRPLFAEYIPAIEMQQVSCMTCMVSRHSKSFTVVGCPKKISLPVDRS